jgi:hypothetical protein
VLQLIVIQTTKDIIMASLKHIKSWMSTQIANYTDECGELNITKLAEDAIIKFNVIEDDETDIFELSASFC